MDVFSLVAKISLDSSEYDKGLNSAKQKASEFGGKLSSGLGKTVSAVGSAVAKVAKVTAAAVGVASTAIGAVVAKSVGAYGEYEQLVGGVNKLYGNMGLSLEEYAKTQGKSTDEVREQWEKLGKAQETVLKNAQNAYRTAGMSANQYMGIATSFSATLIKSLEGDTVKAAEATDKAMTAIADNWNTFGGDIGMIQGAFQGFAKQNYTMLDNLKLGYGGTKTEMERLIADANEYAKSIGEASNLSIDSFADIVTAIDLIQQKQQIAGTTAREASTTIQGSLGMVKAAWENLLTGMSDKEADFETLMSNLVDSVAGYTDEAGEHVNGLLDNIIPVVEKAIEGVGQAIERVTPVIIEKLPGLIQSTLPALINAAATLVSGIAEALPSLVLVIAQQIPGIISQVGSALVQAGGALLDAVGDLLMNLYFGILEFDWNGLGIKVGNLIADIFNPGNNVTAMEHIIACGLGIVEELIRGITKAIPVLVRSASELIIEFAEYLSGDAEDNPHIITAAMEMIGTLASELGKAAPKVIPSVIQSIVNEIRKILEGDGIQSMIDGAVDLVIGLADGLTNPEALGNLIDAAIDLIMALADGLINALPKLIEALPKIIDNIVQSLIKLATRLITVGPELIVKLVLGIIQALPSLVKAVPQIVTTLATAIISYAANLIRAGKNLIERVKEGFQSLDPIQWGRDLIDKFVQGIKGAIGKVKSAVTSVANSVKSVLGFSEPEEGPLSNFHSFAPDMMELFAKGVKDNTDIVTDQLKKSFDIGGLIMSGANTNDTGAAKANLGGVTINVYGAEGQSEERLAELVEKRLLHAYNQQRAVVGYA